MILIKVFMTQLQKDVTNKRLLPFISIIIIPRASRVDKFNGRRNIPEILFMGGEWGQMIPL